MKILIVSSLIAWRHLNIQYAIPSSIFLYLNIQCVLYLILKDQD